MGRVLVSQPVYQLTKDFFLITPRQATGIKGKKGAISWYQVEGPLDDTLARRARKPRPLVGRQAEMARLRQSYRPAWMAVARSWRCKARPASAKATWPIDCLAWRVSAALRCTFLFVARSMQKRLCSVDAAYPFAGWHHIDR